jgi:hypothetical protein
MTSRGFDDVSIHQRSFHGIDGQIRRPGLEVVPVPARAIAKFLKPPDHLLHVEAAHE